MTHITEENNEYWSISLSSIFAVLQKEYKIILLSTLFFLIISSVYIFITPKEYISVGKIMPEVSYKASNGIAGINQLLKKYNGNVDLFNTEITSPELYPEILNTTDFYDYILNKKVTTSSNKKMSFKSYYDLNLKNKAGIIQDIQNRIVINPVKKNNMVFVTAKMQDPIVAADIANFTMTYLIDYITKYRTEKSRQDLRFLENLIKNVEEDSSKNEAIKNEIQNSLSASVIQMKIKIQEDTPTIQVLQKPQIPAANSEPSIPKVFTGFILLGLCIGVAIAFLKNYKLDTNIVIK
ncbi:Wzz/FepE/Etk N-terminal domain-containing protein [Flavobacterium sp.]|uniref:Wzz/FepE/Etk N-terminal domain-containing protein n=1 Tax=Flavobacterium sp. TaxID=239 RepID=UPI0031CF658E